MCSRHGEAKVKTTRCSSVSEEGNVQAPTTMFVAHAEMPQWWPCSEPCALRPQCQAYVRAVCNILQPSTAYTLQCLHDAHKKHLHCQDHARLPDFHSGFLYQKAFDSLQSFYRFNAKDLNICLLVRSSWRDLDSFLKPLSDDLRLVCLCAFAIAEASPAARTQVLQGPLPRPTNF